MSLLQQRRHGGVVLLRLNDPKRRNLMSLELCEALSRAVAQANADEEVKAIVITGASPAFCAGANLDDLEAAAEGETTTLNAVYRSFLDVAESGVPTIAAVNGAAVGAGMNLALACDMRIASEDAYFDTRFLKIGLHPGGGHGWMLLRAVGWAEACRLLLLNRPMRAAEALATGLVQQIVAADRLVDAAIELAQLTDQLPRGLVLRAKATLRHAAIHNHAAAFEHETHEQLQSLKEPPFLALVRRLKTIITAS